MTEAALLEYIADRSRNISERYEQVLVGPGHDCAVITTRGDRFSTTANGSQALLVKVDQLIEGRHFTSQTPARLIARKALARPLSDIAASAGTPLCAVVAATLPGLRTGASNDDRTRELFDAMQQASEEFACPVVGGDLATHHTPDAVLHLSVTVLGRPHPFRGPVLRSGIRPGSFVYVTGALGGSFRKEPDAEFDFPGGGSHLTFTPRLAEARWLADALGDELRAMMDVSDGLGRDAARLAKASNVCIELDAQAIPLGASARDVHDALSDGEDYELLFASPRAPMPATCGPTKTPIRMIGIAKARTSDSDPWCVCRMPDGSLVDVGDVGWDHQ